MVIGVFYIFIHNNFLNLLHITGLPKKNWGPYKWCFSITTLHECLILLGLLYEMYMHQASICTSLYACTATMCIRGWFETGGESIKAATLQEGHSLEKLSTRLYTVSPEHSPFPLEGINSLIIPPGAHHPSLCVASIVSPPIKLLSKALILSPSHNSPHDHVVKIIGQFQWFSLC